MSDDRDFKVSVCAGKLIFNISGKRAPKEILAAENSITAKDLGHQHNKKLQEHIPCQDCSYIQHTVESKENGFCWLTICF